jgi:hypothetical protein
MALLQKISVSDSLHRFFIIQGNTRKAINWIPNQKASFSARNNLALRPVLFALFAQLQIHGRNDGGT